MGQMKDEVCNNKYIKIYIIDPFISWHCQQWIALHSLRCPQYLTGYD